MLETGTDGQPRGWPFALGQGPLDLRALVDAEEGSGHLPRRSLVRLVVAAELAARLVLYEQDPLGAGGGGIPHVRDAGVVVDEVAVEGAGRVDLVIRVVARPADHRRQEGRRRHASRRRRADHDPAGGVRRRDLLVVGDERQGRPGAAPARRLRVGHGPGDREAHGAMARVHDERGLPRRPPTDGEAKLALAYALDAVEVAPDPADVAVLRLAAGRPRPEPAQELVLTLERRGARGARGAAESRGRVRPRRRPGARAPRSGRKAQRRVALATAAAALLRRETRASL